MQLVRSRTSDPLHLPDGYAARGLRTADHRAEHWPNACRRDRTGNGNHRTFRQRRQLRLLRGYTGFKKQKGLQANTCTLRFSWCGGGSNVPAGRAGSGQAGSPNSRRCPQKKASRDVIYKMQSNSRPLRLATLDRLARSVHRLPLSGELMRRRRKT